MAILRNSDNHLVIYSCDMKKAAFSTHEILFIFLLFDNDSNNHSCIKKYIVLPLTKKLTGVITLVDSYITPVLRGIF